MWTPQGHASNKTKKINKAKHITLFTLLYCVDQYAVCVVWYLATTSVLVGGNVVMVELPVSRDDMHYFVACGDGHISGN